MMRLGQGTGDRQALESKPPYRLYSNKVAVNFPHFCQWKIVHFEAGASIHPGEVVPVCT